MKKILFFIYGIIAAITGNLALFYLCFFLGNFMIFNSIDAPREGSFANALCINLGLILLFALQHSLMARQSFKKWWRDNLPYTIERSTYVLLTAIALGLLYYFWQPMGITIWNIESEWLQVIIYSLYFFGWTLIFVSSFLINYWDLMGIRQVYLYLVDKPYTAVDMRTPFFYKNIRHPLYLGLIISFWATPVMTIAHLIFAILLTVYILLAIKWEENDLVADFGDRYLKYRKRVPKLFPEFRFLQNSKK